MSATWSYALLPLSLLGIALQGRDKPYGWLLSIVTQFTWLAYAINTEQWGFILGTVAYAGMYLKNYLHSKKRQEMSKNCDCACHGKEKKP